MIRRKIKVAVPASTSNLGPGFDCLGLALSLYDELTLEVHEGRGPAVIEVEGEGAKTLSRGPENLMVKATGAVLAGRNLGRLVFKAKNAIPLARGLGSSAAAIVCGLTAANELIEKPLDLRELFQYAATLEGHPDNAAPALYGGFTVCIKKHKGVDCRALKPHKDLCAAVCIPDFELSTAKARAVLPDTVLREAAVDNIARTALLTAALERGLWDELAEAAKDRLHQPYRAPLIPGLEAVLEAARKAGPCAAALSGSGPTTIALCRKGPQAQEIAEAMKTAFAKHGVSSRALVLDVEKKGARTIK